MIHNDSMDVPDKVGGVSKIAPVSLKSSKLRFFFGVYFPSALAALYYTNPANFAEGGLVRDLIVCCDGAGQTALSDSNVVRLRSVLVATSGGRVWSVPKCVEGIDAGSDRGGAHLLLRAIRPPYRRMA